MEKLLEFFNDVGVNEITRNNLTILFDNDDDLEYFFQNIFSSEKCFEEMTAEMQDYKLLEQRPITEEDFIHTYKGNEINALQKLFRHYIPKEEWRDIMEIMKIKSLSPFDVYHKQMKNLEQQFICNVWQTIL
ncbi:hypothetical protein U2I54_26440 [Bacillus pseudomycoides]|uniref:Uncharacterized protein n=1 Tax=Bacillus bingmayongensis TaxID=1150157 RepID=A0ABU5K434_9BACI|nr:hypothetical protein [Bacillus pseudomycoides]